MIRCFCYGLLSLANLGCYYLVQIVVASDKDDKVLPIREAFQNVFGQATIVGLPSK